MDYIIEYQKFLNNLGEYHLNLKNLSDEERKIVVDLWKNFEILLTEISDPNNIMHLEVKVKILIVLFRTLTFNNYLITLREKNIEEIIN